MGRSQPIRAIFQPMKPTRILDCVATPDGRELVLYQRDDTFIIQIDNHDLMLSRTHGSEEDLSRLALAALDDRPAPRVLVGGLGMGFTLRAALDGVAERPGAKVVVAEVFPAVVTWNRGVLGPLAGRPLDDPRTEVREGDVGRLLKTKGERYDVILLDVDNGPSALTLKSNRRLYGKEGLERLHRVLTPGGVLAVWSASDDPQFVGLLNRHGFEAESHRVRARASGKGGRHVVFVARRRNV